MGGLTREQVRTLKVAGASTAVVNGFTTALRALRTARNTFARTYVDLIYDKITNGGRRFLRVEELVYEVASLCPGLCPTRQDTSSSTTCGT